MLLTPGYARARLFELRDDEYADFTAKLVPEIPRERIIGVRIPALRDFEREMKDNYPEPFLRDLPHKYYDESCLHSLIINGIEEYDLTIQRLDRFLRSVDNWAVCDMLSPKCFKKRRNILMMEVERWLTWRETYAVRFAVRMLMLHFLDDEFAPEYPELVAGICRDEYYIRMMKAWYFATALAKRYDDIIPFIEQRRLESWTHNKTIQKATESRRISPEQKAYLHSLHVKD